MKNAGPITPEIFKKKLINLCLRSGMTQFPSDENNRNILCKSAVVGLDDARSYTDKEINQHLEWWLMQICPMETIDFITLRRLLVDAGYLTRNPAGTVYNVCGSAPHPGCFDPAVDNIDVEEVIRTAREDIERRKTAYMEKSSHNN